jgi:hypothetical protein
VDYILSIIKAAFAGSGELLGLIIGLSVVGLLFLAGVVPIYFILKKISGSQTTFAEDLQEYLTARPQPQPEILGRLSALDSIESSVLRIYKYALIVALVLGSVFIVWFFLNVEKEAERSFLRLYFGAAYLFLVFWVLGSFVAMKRRRQARNSPAARIQAAAPLSEPPLRGSINPAASFGDKVEPSKDVAPAASALTPQQIVIVILAFVFAVATFTVILLMLQGLPDLPR